MLGISSIASQAQGTSDPYRWESLPDSLFLIWHLDKDQIDRLRVIEEDYTTERGNVTNDTRLSTAQQQQRLKQLGDSRREEIKGVLQTEYYIDWQRRMK